MKRLASLPALCFLIIGLALPPAAAAAGPARWAWVVARNSTTSSYVPAAIDQGNVAGSSNTVKRTGLGQYTVIMPGVITGSPGGGDVQVSALNTAQRYCNVGSWGAGSSPTELRIYVRCFLFGGAAADSKFSASFLTKGYNSGLLAYVWADQPSTTDYTANSFYAFPTNITIHRSSAGHYLVRLPNSDPDHGNVQVTGYGMTPCKIGETSSDGTAMIVGVVCPRGDTLFDLLYTKSVALTGITRPKAAYLRGFPLAPAGGRAPVQFRYSSVGMAPSISRTGVGIYEVTLPGMPNGGVAHVTAGPGADTCWLTSIRTGATPQQIGVACANLGGAPADAAFDLSYTK